MEHNQMRLYSALGISTTGTGGYTDYDSTSGIMMGGNYSERV